ncbi:MAG: hypothetical protein KKA42_15355 [candidate division Zixibacteria bacterium]|nr:hypothetical protein [candidate division Zixibacteria bacterium]
MDYQTLLRHSLATLAYRTRHALQETPVGFEDFEAGLDARTPLEILHHVNGILSLADRKYRGKKPEPNEQMSWVEEIESFHQYLNALDRAIAEGSAPDDETMLRIYQGPICDALTHVGELMLLRRLFGSPVVTANYYQADIQVGALGPGQPLPA